MNQKINITQSDLAKKILYSFIDGLATAKDKKEQLKKLIHDFEIALDEDTENEQKDTFDEKPKESKLL